MAATTMHFGPEWMRPKQTPTRPAPSPPLSAAPSAQGVSSYSALVAPATQPPPEKNDIARPFRYSKEDLLRIYKEGGGKGGLGLEVERWEGIVREIGYEPISLREMSDAEKKLFAGPLNSEIRRRQPTADYLSPLATSTLGERPKLGNTNSGLASPMRERIGPFVGRRRGDSTDQPPLTLPRKQSLSSIQGPLASPRDAPLPSPRVRVGMSSAFDGVLNEAWASKRRVSDGLTKSVSKTDLRESQKDVTKPAIKEEEEARGKSSQSDPAESDPARQSQPALTNGHPTSGPGYDAGRTEISEKLPGGFTTQSLPPGPPPGILDLASVEWSYLDPQGQIQGPFRADVMQKWYDEGYFTPELLMKRTHIDAEWTAVRDLQRLTGTDRIFLTPLQRRPELLGGPMPDRPNIYGSPFESAPRAIRTHGLDTFLHNGSNASDSPTSSFSTGRFGNNSPDPSILGGRMGNQVHPNVGNNVFGGLNNMEPMRRALDESFDSPVAGRQPYTPTRAVLDGVGFNDRAIPYSPGPTDAGSVQGVTGLLRGQQDLHMANGQPINNLFGNNMGQIGYNGQLEQSRLLRARMDNRPDLQTRINGPFASENGSPFLANAQAYTPALEVPYQQQEVHTLPHVLGGLPERRASVSPHHDPNALQQSQVYPLPPREPASPWGTPDIGRRPGPFDEDYPTTHNTFVRKPVLPAQPNVNGQPNQAPTLETQSPWPTSQPASTGWPSDSVSLTAANLGQHNKHEQQEQERAQEASVQPASARPTAAEPVAPVAPAPATATSVVSPESASGPTKKKRKDATKAVQSTTPSSTVTAAPAPAPAPAPPSTKPSSPTPSPAEAKPAWAIDEDHKAVSSGSVMSLREIQEAEAKQAEARKAAERERARAATAVSSAHAEDLQPFTASWGLPISQAGAAARASNPLLKESNSSSSPASAPATPAVWTNAPKPQAKKTMKEIQEEEENRKKLAAKEKDSVAAAAKRAYAETTTKVVPSASSAVQGAWTTVGSGGKTSVAAIAAATAVRPPLTPSSSKPAVAAAPATRPAAVPPPVRASPSLATSNKVSTSKGEDALTPSSDFLKWLSESLKGLNSSVNFEEITSMLLSFPLDPDPSTVELISDLIYANSTTLDGRRFASEFVSRRKASTKTSAPLGAVGKPLSIADVVKTQPKPAQNEWGGFKVVNKKKKGTRV